MLAYGDFLVLYPLVQCDAFQAKMIKFKDYYCKLTLLVYVVPPYHKNSCINFTAYNVLSNSFDSHNNLVI